MDEKKVLAFLRFLLTRLMRGVTEELDREILMLEISTHTPHARRDQKITGPSINLANFYSHASCEA